MNLQTEKKLLPKQINNLLLLGYQVLIERYSNVGNVFYFSRIDTLTRCRLFGRTFYVAILVNGDEIPLNHDEKFNVLYIPKET